MDARPAPSRAILPIAFGLALLAVGLAYLPILPATLVADDYRLLSSEFLDQPLRYFGEELFPDLPQQVYWRPLPVLTFALDRALRGTGTVAPHLANLLLHLATTLALGLTVLSVGWPGTGASGSRTMGAVAGMLLFGLHPQAAGAVAWIAARFDLLAGLFGTLGLLLCVRRAAADEASAGRVVAISLLFAAALLCKESALAFPAAVFLWTLMEALGRRRRARRREDAIFLIALAALVASYAALRTWLIGWVGSDGGNPLFGVFWQTGVGFLLALAWPFTGTGAVPWPLLYFAVTALVATAAVGCWALLRQDSVRSEPAAQWRLPLLLLAVSLAGLTVGGIPVGVILRGAESRLSYTPLIAAGLLAGWLLQRAWASGRWRWPSLVAFLLVSTAFTWSQQYRVSEWQRAGRLVDGLLASTTRLVPDPPPNSTLVFRGIPLTTTSYCYVFGIGLPEAIAERYGRSDLRVMRWGETLQRLPEDAYVFSYRAREGTLTLDQRPD